MALLVFVFAASTVLHFAGGGHGASAVKDHIGALAEELDATRKSVLAEHPDLSLTGLYNVLEKLRAGSSLTGKDESMKIRGRVLILKELHEQIDRAVVQAYGWPSDLTDEQLLERLAALNRERAAEERRGLIRWLRPAYQIEKIGPLAHRADRVQTLAVAARSKRRHFPKEAKEQGSAVIQLMRHSDRPLTAAEVAASFGGGERVIRDVQEILRSLNRLGELDSHDGGRSYIAAA